MHFNALGDWNIIHSCDAIGVSNLHDILEQLVEHLGSIKNCNFDSRVKNLWLWVYGQHLLAFVTLLLLAAGYTLEVDYAFFNALCNFNWKIILSCDALGLANFLEILHELVEHLGIN